MTHETFHEIMQYGGSTAALVALLWVMYKAGRYIGLRLFAEETGIVTRWLAEKTKTEEQIRDYMDTDVKRTASQSRLCEVHAEAIKDTSSDIQSLGEAAIKGCEMCRVWSEAFPDQKDELGKLITEIERIIQSK